MIGDIIGATCAMVSHGHETWHPDPEFYYKRAGGPMMDMGPYYTTALINLLGPVKTVTGMAKASFPTRTITSEPHYGEVVKVEVNTHIAGLMEFANGVTGTIITSFDVYKHKLPIIEIYGTEGSLSVPDPNGFGGPIFISRKEKRDFLEFPVTFPYPENSRALGLADMAKAIQTGRKHRASVDLTFHVLEVMTGFTRSAEAGKHIEMTTVPERPAPMKNDITMKGILD
jgi:predicted dehydrogenase